MNDYRFSTFRMTVILMVGFLSSILIGLSSCNDANAQNKNDQFVLENTPVYQPETLSEVSEVRNAPETEYITISKKALEEALTTVRLAERAKYEKIIQNPHLVSKSTNNTTTKAMSSKTAVKASTNDSNSKIGLVGTLTVNDDDPTVYDVFKGAKGGLYFFRISKETGNEYKAYIQKDSKLYHRINWEQ